MYESFYGLREKPFSLLPDPGFLYFSKKHRLALTMLEYGLTNQAGFTVISGGIGTGKTTLIRYLLNNMEQDTTVGLITNTHRSFGELLQWVLLAYDLDHTGKDKVGMYHTFVDFMIQEYAQKRRTILIVDEAQNMEAETLEELRMLSNVNADKDQILQVILVGQQELRDTLRRPELVQFAQRISVDYHLTPLDADETAAYIAHRLQVAGGAPNLFEPDASATIHHYSTGIPRLINLLCDTSLVYSFAEQIDSITIDIVNDVARDKRQGGIFPGLGPSEDEKEEKTTSTVTTLAGSSESRQADSSSESYVSEKHCSRVAIACDSEQLRRHLKEQLELNGLRVIYQLTLDDQAVNQVDPEEIDALIVDLDEETLLFVNDPSQDKDQRIGSLCGQLARWDLPVIFNDSQATLASLEGENPGFGAKLATKIASLLPNAPGTTARASR